jgi:hypothetical protein
MMAAKLLDRSVVIRELMPQDLKIEIERLNKIEALSLSRYLASVTDDPSNQIDVDDGGKAKNENCEAKNDGKPVFADTGRFGSATR